MEEYEMYGYSEDDFDEWLEENEYGKVLKESMDLIETKLETLIKSKIKDMVLDSKEVFKKNDELISKNSALETENYKLKKEMSLTEDKIKKGIGDKIKEMTKWIDLNGKSIYKIEATHEYVPCPMCGGSSNLTVNNITKRCPNCNYDGTVKGEATYNYKTYETFRYDYDRGDSKTLTFELDSDETYKVKAGYYSKYNIIDHKDFEITIENYYQQYYLGEDMVKYYRDKLNKVKD